MVVNVLGAFSLCFLLFEGSVGGGGGGGGGSMSINRQTRSSKPMAIPIPLRSEERREGKEGRSRWARDH